MIDDTAAVGLLHPGSMGAELGGQLRRRGVTVLWCSVGRSTRTRRRAEEAGLTEVADLQELVHRSRVLFSICPPEAAEEVAQNVAAQGFTTGVYVEANPVTPERLHRIAAALPRSLVVDGSVIGSPPRGGKQPRLCLSGPTQGVKDVVSLFDDTDVRVRVLGTELGKASSLKLAYTSFQKASRVMAALSYAMASDHDVQDELLSVAAERSTSYLLETEYISKTAERAWRWGPELLEAADLLDSCGLPAEPVRGAASALAHWASEGGPVLGVEEALARLRSNWQ